MNSVKTLFTLTEGGPEDVPESVIEWLDRVVCDVRQALDDEGPLTVSIWPYRHGATYLVCDIFAEPQHALYDMTICVDGPTNLSFTKEPQVPDLADALHLVTLVANALGARVKLGLDCPISDSDSALVC